MEQSIFKDDLSDDDEGYRKDNEAHISGDYDDTVSEPGGFLENVTAMLPHSDRVEIVKIIGRKRSADENFVGGAHKNVILDSRVFVRFLDGYEKDYSYNVLAEYSFE